MGSIVFIEVLDRSEGVSSRHRFSHFPVRVGRGYRNDLVIDDPFVCAEHLRLEEVDGAVHVVNCSDVNGTTETTAHRKLRDEILERVLHLQIGQTKLRILSEAFEVGPAQKLPQHHRRMRSGRTLESPWFAPALLFSYLLFHLAVWYYCNNYLNLSQGKLIAGTLLSLIIILVVVLSWAGTWGVVSRLNRGRSYFFAHAAFFVLALIGIHVVTFASDYFGYAFSAQGIAQHLRYLGYFLVGGCMCSIQLRYSTHLRKQMAKTYGFGVSFLLVALLISGTAALRSIFTDIPRVQETLKPPMFHLTGGETPEKFFADLDSMGLELKDDAKDD